MTAKCVSGECVDVLQVDGALCDDGNPCTESTACKQGVCDSGVAKACDDGQQCTSDSCDSTTGDCIHQELEALVHECRLALDPIRRQSILWNRFENKSSAC